MPNTTDPSPGIRHGERVAALVPPASERPGRTGPYRQPIRRPPVLHPAIATLDKWIVHEREGFYTALEAAKLYRDRIPVRAADAVVMMKYRRIEVARLLRIRRELVAKLKAIDER